MTSLPPIPCAFQYGKETNYDEDDCISIDEEKSVVDPLRSEFTIRMGGLTLCDIDEGTGRCRRNVLSFPDNTSNTAIRLWITLLQYKIDSITERLSTVLDQAYVYKCTMALYCVVTKGRDALHTSNCGEYEIHTGQMGFTTSVAQNLFDRAVWFIERNGSRGVIHWVDEMILTIRRMHVPLGGSLRLAQSHRERCHPAVCVCSGTKKRSLLFKTCHHWYIDTLLSSNTDKKSGHPMAVFPGTRIPNDTKVNTIETVLTVADDVVFGGSVQRGGHRTKYSFQIPPSKFGTFAQSSLDHSGLSETSTIIFLFFLPYLTLPGQMCETVLHELAHGMQLRDEGLYDIQKEEHHGERWQRRIRQLEGYFTRFTVSSASGACSRIRMRMRCGNCGVTCPLLNKLPDPRFRKCGMCDSSRIFVVDSEVTSGQELALSRLRHHGTERRVRHKRTETR